MGASCCTPSETAPGSDATVDARPVLDSSLQTWPPVAGGDTEKERIFIVKLRKTGELKLGLDVDFMAERSVLPIMTVTGGLAEKWNQEHPELPISRGDSILEVNGVSGDLTQMLDRCKTDTELQLTLCKCLSYDHLVSDLEKLISSKGCGPILVRLSWQDAGVFNGVDGCPNAAMRLLGSGENAMGANASLPDAAIGLLRGISDKYVPRLISHADLWALAANVAIRAMGGPEIPTRFGRVDVKTSAGGVPHAVGRLPDGDQDAKHIREIFGPKGFADKDIVALSGAHTVGSFEGPWTASKLKFDNSYFKDLLNKKWEKETNSKGKIQYRCGDTMMLTTDMALIEDESFKVHVEKYAADQKLWFEDFTKAWVSLQEFGLEELREIL